MPIFEIRQEGLVRLPPTSFQAEGLLERADLQRMLRDSIECLEDGLMVIAEEFSWWLDSTRRIDLLCIDSEAKLVVVELKRDEDGGHMELQALRYAAMVSAMTFDMAAQTLAQTRNSLAPDMVVARADMQSFLGGEDFEEENFGREVRIILAAADFSRELTTTVLWLRASDIDIRCIRLKPYRIEPQRLLVDVQTLIPLPEAEDYQTRLGEKRRAEQKDRAERHDLRLAFLHGLLAQAAGRSLPHVNRTPSDMGVLTGAIGRAGFSINYVTGQTESRVEMLVQTENAKQQFAALMASKEQIEAAFCGPLIWQEKPGSRQCRIYHTINGGYRSSEADWSTVQEALIQAMLRLDSALRPYVSKLI